MEEERHYGSTSGQINPNAYYFDTSQNLRSHVFVKYSGLVQYLFLGKLFTQMEEDNLQQCIKLWYHKLNDEEKWLNL
jgi:hypothetical protein